MIAEADKGPNLFEESPNFSYEDENADDHEVGDKKNEANDEDETLLDSNDESVEKNSDSDSDFDNGWVNETKKRGRQDNNTAASIKRFKFTIMCLLSMEN